MSRNQVSPSPSDLELEKVDRGQEPVTQQPGNTEQGSKSSLRNNLGVHQSSNRETSPVYDHMDVGMLNPEKSSLSRLSLKSEDKVPRRSPDFPVNQQAYTDEPQLVDDNQYQPQNDTDSIALDDHLAKESTQGSEQFDNTDTKNAPFSYIREGTQSRFVQDETEGLVYEPGLPAMDVHNGTIQYKTPSDDELLGDKSADKGYQTETSSVGYTRSNVDDGDPQVLNKEPTVFTGATGGPNILPVSSNQVRPVDDRTYEMTEMRQRPGGESLERKKSFIIGTNENTDGAGCCGWVLYIFSLLLIIVTLPFSLIFTIKVVQEYERAVIFRLGRLPMGGAKGPGIFFIIPCIESYTKVDLRTVSFDVPPQEVLTKDSVTVSVDAVVYYRVSNPTVSVANVENAHHSTRLLAQTTLRNILGTKDMTDLLADRESISQGMQSTLDVATDRWGIKVERVEIKDVRLPVQLQRAMAAEAEASREARAKVIAAEGEQKAARSLKEAAEIMGKSGAALQLRYLQTLNSISAEKNSTIIFPLPLDMMSTLMKK